MINVLDLEFSYKGKGKVLKDINFYAPKGECTAILGNNGAGKSTLIKCINRILKPQRGVVNVDGKNIGELKRQDIAKYTAYVAQRNEGERITVFDCVLMGRIPYIKFEPSREDIQIVESTISRMGLEGLSLRYIDELSGGEMQKVMLARALTQQPKVLLLDEPTSNLDIGNQYEVLATIQQIAKTEQISVIIVIHDLNLALRYCDKFLLLKDSRIISYGGIETITPENINRVYKITAAVEKVNGVTVVIPFPSPSHAVNDTF